MIHDVHAHILVRKVFIYNIVAKNSKVIANNLLSIKRQVNTWIKVEWSINVANCDTRKPLSMASEIQCIYLKLPDNNE